MGSNPQLERYWAAATRPETLGFLLLAAGLILFVTPWLRRPEPAAVAADGAGQGGVVMDAVTWWSSAFYAPDALGIAAGFAAVAAILGLGALWNRYALARRTRKVADEAQTQAERADALIASPGVSEAVQDLVDASRRPLWAWVGAGSMLVGAALLAGFWFVVQQDLAPAWVDIARGEVMQHYEVTHGGKTMKVNLPRRVRLSELSTGAEPSAAIQIFRAGDNPAESPSMSRTLPAGTGVTVDGVRLTFSGVKPREDTYRAVLESTEADTIPATAGVGETFRFGLEGPSYKVVSASKNYLDALGPAVEVETPEMGTFWVFQRHQQAAVRPDLGHPIRLKQLETQVAAVFTVAPVHSFWPVSLGGTLLVLGFALLIIFPERLVRVMPGGKIGAWSFHEAGRLAEEVRARADENGESEVSKADALRLNLFRGAALVGWAGVLIGAGGIYAGQFSSFAALLLTAASAGLVVAPAHIRSATVGKFAAIGALIPLAAVVFALVLSPKIAGEPADLMLLLAGQWGLFCAALVSALAAGSLGVGRWWAERGDSDPHEVQVVGLYARDFALRATVLGWIFWLVTMLIHWRQFGAIGMASPADWTLMGGLLLATSALLIFWSRRRPHFEPIFLIYLAILAVGVIFGAPFGLLI